MAKIIKSIPLLLIRCHCRNNLVTHNDLNGIPFSDTGLNLGLDCARKQCRFSPLVIRSMSIRTWTLRAMAVEINNKYGI